MWERGKGKGGGKGVRERGCGVILSNSNPVDGGDGGFMFLFVLESFSGTRY